MSFDNKVVIVTGASSGIGAATAIEFAKQGADVILVGRNKTKLNNVAADCSKAGKKPLIITADVTKDDDVKKILNDTITKYEKIDVLVNNAGAGELSSIKDERAVEVFDKMIDLNLRSVVQLTNLTLPYLIKTKGNIVNVSSIAALRVLRPGSFAYCVSKAGLDHFTKCAAKEFAEYGVRVNSVNPGPVKTDILANMNQPDPNAYFKYMATETALKRISEPEEIADVVVVLASNKAKGVTGSSWVTDNGRIL